MENMPEEVRDAVVRITPNRDFQKLIGWMETLVPDLAIKCATTTRDDHLRRYQGAYTILKDLTDAISGSKNMVDKIEERRARGSLVV